MKRSVVGRTTPAAPILARPPLLQEGIKASLLFLLFTAAAPHILPPILAIRV